LAPTSGASTATADAVLAQQRRRADARELQQLRRLQRAGREDRLALGRRTLQLAALAPLDADGAARARSARA
jgi:hypothetical protein